ncbi:DNA topoisomerase VI subunit B [Methanococcoides burtonii]|uniref:Type 2 DNA topoisomerase 6 subunit B n=1 Tax=Methanococcoides burtonii (strain DSM 6242 / NBRC 107633 / OCM 468 / ACE-M) TaxID=259564 RepID=TOP6B_METBU|nr:DNA topoisomerase VI subunit B [Methanococcoides burtonii]Q12WQ0.1 RecName: Full=Type 2 DNA topoisomerase 6 subunit B; AltName: Full=Type II DNA topoisomerase VI subunit B; Short=TopoVI-B [Methanococcoides burtonii DSM 6242]ABE52126.1 DNA topoisomerase, type VI subunit B [Methanococcoides burtonii DSM 6242]
MAAPIAEELAKKQQAISVAEFFEKNRQILGFDSAPRSLITTVKEAVDNSLDACEEAEILPDILLHIERVGKDNVSVIVEDNGPGIVKEQIPKVFAKLLYGSRFHALKQSRGQQGIGISASVLYAQLTAGHPTSVISKIGPDSPAHHYEVMINTSTNDPEILLDEVIDWDRPHGTRVELEMEASYVKGRRQSIYEYLKATAIVNPHARLTLIEPDGNEVIFDRATDKLPIPAKEILPHPHGIELGTLMKMLRYTDRQKLAPFLRYSFSKIGLLTAEEICKAAGLDTEMLPSKLTRDQTKKLLDAFKKVKIMAPPTDCLSPIGEELIYKGLEKEFNVDFIATTTRSPSVFSGNPFVVEVGIAYGGVLQKDDRIDIMRFANRVPLLYQQGGCATTHAVEGIKWKQYGLNQPGGGMPTGPVVLLVHVASTNVPFTSESKDAIADIPEIRDEVELAIKEVSRKLNRYLNRQVSLKKRREKEIIITKVLPKMAQKLADTLERDLPDINPVVAKVMGNLLVMRHVEHGANGDAAVTIKVKNFGSKLTEFKLHDMLPYEISDVSPEPKVISMGSDFDYVWTMKVSPEGSKAVTYSLSSMSEDEIKRLPQLIVEGLDEELVTGAKAIKGLI